MDALTVTMDTRTDKLDSDVDKAPVSQEPLHIVNKTDLLCNESVSDISSDEYANWISITQDFFTSIWTCHYSVIKNVFVVALFLGYWVFFGFALRYKGSDSTALITLTSVTVFLIGYTYGKRWYGNRVDAYLCIPVATWFRRRWHILQWGVYPVLLVGLSLYLALGVIKTTRQLQSLLGMVVFLLIPLLTCKHPTKIRWRPVLWGLSLQLVIGILVLRWRPGYQAVRFLADEANKFLAYSLNGAGAVFGDPFFLMHPFAMAIVPLVVFLGCVMSMLYYMGVTQAIVHKLGWLMSITLQTTPIESVSLAANIFLSVLDTMLMLKPYMPSLTKSEFHTFLVGSHATIAGFVFAIFVWMGVSPMHLLTSAVMSAPAAVAISKLNYPETEISKFKIGDRIQLEKLGDANVVEAGSRGAWEAGKSVCSIVIQVIAFVSVYSFINATVAWFGAQVGWTLDLSIIFSYLFRPCAFLMGIEWKDTEVVGSLLGLKVMANELLAFLQLGQIRLNNVISERSAALVTYAMCGFSSFGTLAIFVGVWSTVDPSKVSVVSSQIPRVLLNTNISCFLTACVAGIFYDETTVGEGDDESIQIIAWIFSLIPSYKDLMKLIF